MNKNENILVDAEKIDEICRFFKTKVKNFAEKVGVNPQQFYSIRSQNQAEFSRDTMIAIVKKCPEISPYWLITGEGSITGGTVTQHNVNGDNLNNSQKSSIPTHIVETLTDTNASQQRTIEKLVNLINN